MNSSILRRSRRGLPIAAAAAAALVLAGCTANSPSTSGSSGLYKGIRIDFVSGPLNDPTFPPMYAGAMQAGKDLGVKVKWIPIDEANIEQTSVTTMDTAIADKPDAIVVGDFITSAVDPQIKKAIAAEIPVYVDQSGRDNWEADGAFGYIGPDPQKIGDVAGAELARQGAKSILCVNNIPDNPYLATVCAATKEGARSKGATSTVLNLAAADNNDPTKNSASIGAYLKTHPDIDGIMTLGPQHGNEASSGAKAAVPDRKIRIGVLGTNKAGLQAVKDGTLAFALDEQPYLDGYYGVLAAVQYVKFGLHPIGQVVTGPHLINSENIDQILKVAAKYPQVIGAS
ncbi:substrate-binding domain-containing protein [uncultured Amnibacterium sp.]|uniref:substrate-binding domain-containing protein n=1 Tax=uncultured Amnibacterium sp. TaxID=1631851 RepID=UPI0035CA4FBC